MFSLPMGWVFSVDFLYIHSQLQTRGSLKHFTIETFEEAKTHTRIYFYIRTCNLHGRKTYVNPDQLRACIACLERVPCFVVVLPGYTPLCRFPLLIQAGRGAYRNTRALTPSYSVFFTAEPRVLVLRLFKLQPPTQLFTRRKTCRLLQHSSLQTHDIVRTAD